MSRTRITGLLLVALAAAACTSADDSDIPSTTFAPLALTTATTDATTTTTAVLPTTTTSSTTTTTLPPNECVPEPVSGFDAEGFFTQGCIVLGVSVVASSEVDPEAVLGAADRLHGVLATRLEYAEELRMTGVTVAVIGAGERITHLPPFEDLYEIYPGTDWQRAGRSFSATDAILWIAGAEENLLCSEDDRYSGEDMFLRELGRTLRDYPVRTLDPRADEAIEHTYGRAVAAGLWVDTLAENNSDTYWMEGVQTWFDANREADPPDTAHNFVDTREELRDYDPALYEILRLVLGETDYRGPCS